MEMVFSDRSPKDLHREFPQGDALRGTISGWSPLEGSSNAGLSSLGVLTRALSEGGSPQGDAPRNSLLRDVILREVSSWEF